MLLAACEAESPMKAAGEKKERRKRRSPTQVRLDCLPNLLCNDPRDPAGTRIAQFMLF
jgi:hypothetical protein